MLSPVSASCSVSTLLRTQVLRALAWWVGGWSGHGATIYDFLTFYLNLSCLTSTTRPNPPSHSTFGWKGGFLSLLPQVCMYPNQWCESDLGSRQWHVNLFVTWEVHFPRRHVDPAATSLFTPFQLASGHLEWSPWSQPAPGKLLSLFSDSCHIVERSPGELSPCPVWQPESGVDHWLMVVVVRGEQWSFFGSDGMGWFFSARTIGINGFSMVLLPFDHHH